MPVSPVDLQFPFLAKKPIVACFDGGDITSDAGMLLLAQADRKLGLTAALCSDFRDRRQAGKVKHPLIDLLRERLFAIAMGYEDGVDLDTLASDPALLAACGRRLLASERLAGQPTISRMENAADRKDLLSMAWSIAEVVVAQLPGNPRRIVLDVDASEDPCHGQQELELFNGFYDSHCYLPLFLHVTAQGDRQRLLAALLRPGNSDGKVGLFALLRRALILLRERFPKAEIVLRADGGFGQAEVIAFCEEHGLTFVLGLPGNRRLQALGKAAEQEALDMAEAGVTDTRFYHTFSYRADTWRKAQRVIQRIEVAGAGANTRFVVTNMPDVCSVVYGFYCQRGDQENRIKELKLDLASGRTSCHRFLANQFRLLLFAAASTLFSAIQDALADTRFAHAQIATIRRSLLKVGAQARESVRALRLRLPSSCPVQALWRLLHVRLAQT